LLAAFLVCHARADVGDWLKSVAAEPTPRYTNAPPAVVLLEETILDVDSHGQFEETHRLAIRILHLAAKDKATGSVVYNGKSDRVPYAEAWLWRNGEIAKLVQEHQWIDLADNSTGAVVDEMRKKVADCRSEAVVGDVFGVETRVKGPLLVAQSWYRFGGTLPVLTERLTVAVPAGFQFHTQVFGERQPFESRSADGRAHTWTATNRPYRPEETLPGRGAYVDAALCVSIDPPASAASFSPRRFGGWEDVAAWQEQLNEDSFDTSPELAAKARELAGSGDTLAKIRAITAYVQGTRYIEINRGLRTGLGYKARKASVVFSTGYGDCKDKANLLRAMLREVGLHAYMAAARIGDDFDVRPECPTPGQFNHAITAIKVDPTIALPSVVEAGKLGRLLLVDPTSKHTVVGDLPSYIQGTRIMVISHQATELVTVPDIDAETGFKVTRKATLSLLSNGVVSVAAEVDAYGQAGAYLRSLLREADVPQKFDELVMRQFSDGFKGAQIQEKRSEDDRTVGRCSLFFTGANKGLVQPLSGGLSVVKLDVLSRRNLPVLAEKERHLPLGFSPLSLSDEIILQIPAGMTVDEIPANASIESPYGHYQISFEKTGVTVVAHRKIAFNKLEVPAEDYAKLKAFLSAIARADRCSVILKQGG
jgi:transglutaminase-like putative cysteine protease